MFRTEIIPERRMSANTAERQRRWYSRQKAGIAVLSIEAPEERLVAMFQDVGLLGPDPTRTELETVTARWLEHHITRYEQERWDAI
jgi:hypothetical protein